MQLYTFADMAARICEIDRREDVKVVQEQIRGFHQRGLLKGVDHAGPRGAVRVTLDEFCRARLLLILLDLGVRGESLARASASITDGGTKTYPDGKTLRRTLSKMIAGTRSGETWLLSGGMYADEGGVGFSVRLVMDSEVNRTFSAENTEGDTMLPGSLPVLRMFTLYAQVKIPASELIRPLLSEA